jgi:hypothetical protein
VVEQVVLREVLASVTGVEASVVVVARACKVLGQEGFVLVLFKPLLAGL